MSPPANPHAHVGRDFGGRFATSGLEISIRAPAWGATHPERLSGLRQVVSIHAPAWGATSSTPPLQQSSPCFNPRARVGRDSWIATVIPIRRWFQSTRPRGARLSMNRFQYLVLRFQSTRPRGARLRIPSSPTPRPCFNPRARVGRDHPSSG